MATKHRVTTENDSSWHFSRTFSFDSIIQIVGIAVVLGLPILYWGRSLESRVLTLENFNSASLAADLRREGDTREQRVTFKAQLDKMEERLSNMQISISQLLAVQAIPRPPSPIARR